MFVTAGFIVGFDTEKGSIGPAMIDFVEEASIAVCMVGLLYALPGTQLTRRLAKPASLGRSKRSSILPGRPRPMERRPNSSPTMFAEPLQLTNEAQVRVHRRNGVVVAKMEDETRSDHRTIILLQIQEAPAVAGCLCIPISDICSRCYLRP
jgi:hypothetical protein